MTSLKEDRYSVEEKNEAYKVLWGSEMPDFTNGNGKSKNKKQRVETQEQEQKQEQQQRQEQQPTISFTEWSNNLYEKYSNLQKEILNLIPELWEPLEFALSVRSILRIESITLPFAGIILGPGSSLKTAVIELFRKTNDTYYTDNFSAKAFVSHNSGATKEKLEKEIDLLPKIKDKLFLTPELSPTFSKKDDELNEVLGIITRVLDGHGYESDSGSQGHRGYNDKYMFTWIGAAVDIPRKVYRLLSTLGPKLYFFRIKTVKKTNESYLDQLRDEDVKGHFGIKIEKIKLKLFDYLEWFDLKTSDSEEEKKRIDDNVLLSIIRLAVLLAHLRGNVPVWETQGTQGSDYSYTSPNIEEPDRAITQLRNLARGHALSQGRSQITIDDIPLLIKVALSTASRERVIMFDYLLENNGQLDTEHISDHLMISKNTALRIMTELTILGLVDKISLSSTNHNAFQIQLKEEFKWFLHDEFKELRENFGKEYYNEYLSDKKEESKEKDGK